MSRPRVAMVTDHFAPFRGGLEVHTEELAVALQASGLTVYVTTVQRPPTTPRRDVLRGITIHRAGGPGTGPVRLVVALARTVTELWRSRHDVDVVHSHTFGDATLAAWIASRMTRLPLIIEDHRGGPDGNLAVLHRRRMGRSLWRLYRRDPNVTLLSISTEISEGLLAAGADPRRLRRRWNGVDTEVFRPPTDEEKARLRRQLHLPAGAPVVVFVGRIAPVKGIEHLLDAWATVPAPAELVIVGDGPMLGAMRDLARQLDLERIRFTGRVDSTADYLRAADAWTLPSLAEGLPISLLEAMATGIACVATAVGGVPDMIEHGRDGLLVPAGDPGALAGALRLVCADPVLARALGAAARSTAEMRFDMRTVARTYADLYREVASRDDDGVMQRSGD